MYNAHPSSIFEYIFCRLSICVRYTINNFKEIPVGCVITKNYIYEYNLFLSIKHSRTFGLATKMYLLVCDEGGVWFIALLSYLIVMLRYFKLIWHLTRKTYKGASLPFIKFKSFWCERAPNRIGILHCYCIKKGCKDIWVLKFECSMLTKMKFERECHLINKERILPVS